MRQKHIFLKVSFFFSLTYKYFHGDALALHMILTWRRGNLWYLELLSFCVKMLDGVEFSACALILKTRLMKLLPWTSFNVPIWVKDLNYLVSDVSCGIAAVLFVCLSCHCHAQLLPIIRWSHLQMGRNSF